MLDCEGSPVVYKQGDIKVQLGSDMMWDVYYKGILERHYSRDRYTVDQVVRDFEERLHNVQLEKHLPGLCAKDYQVGGEHYKTMAIQPSEFITRNNLNWCEGNAIKYICRHAIKNGAQDIDKAIHYLQLLKEIEYAETEEGEAQVEVRGSDS